MVPKEGAHSTTGANDDKKNEVTSKDKKKITSELNTSKFIIDYYHNNRNARCFRIGWALH